MKKVIFIGLICFSAVSVHAALTLEDVLANVENQEMNITTVGFDFSQDVDFSATDTHSQVKGTALFGKQGRFKVMKKSPNEQWMISDGKNVSIYTPAYKQVVVSSAKGWVRNSVLPAGMIPVKNYVSDLKKNFNLSLEEGDSSADRVSIVALPRDAKVGYQLTIAISTVNWLPVQTLYTSESAKVKTTFQNVEPNPVVGEQPFRFTPPSGTEVVSMN
jgi:outer membrane lipoprotein carrier protein